MSFAPGVALESAQVETIAATGVEDHVGRSRIDDLRYRQTLMLRAPSVVQASPRCNHFCRITRVFGAPFLRLQQVDVSAPRDVEGVLAWADHSPLVARQRQLTAAYGA